MPVIDLLAGLKEIGSTRSAKGGATVSKMVVEISAPSFPVNLDDAAMAGAMATAVVEQMKTNILSGAKLDGTPAKGLAASTIERREYRVLQGKREGALADRYVDKEFRKDGRKHFRQRFKTAKLGSFNPAQNPRPGLRGVESGLLLNSIVAEPNGKVWRIFFANVRALTDRTGMSPVGRAFGFTPADHAALQRIISQPSVRKRLESSLKQAINGKKTPSLLAELEKTAQSIQGLAGELEE